MAQLGASGGQPWDSVSGMSSSPAGISLLLAFVSQCDYYLLAARTSANHDIFGGFRRDRLLQGLMTILNHECWLPPQHNHAHPSQTNVADSGPSCAAFLRQVLQHYTGVEANVISQEGEWLPFLKCKLLEAQLTKILSQCFQDDAAIRQFYHEDAFLRSPPLVALLLEVTQCLDDLDVTRFSALKHRLEDEFSHWVIPVNQPSSTPKSFNSLRRNSLSAKRSASLSAKSSSHKYVHSQSMPVDFLPPTPEREPVDTGTIPKQVPPSNLCDATSLNILMRRRQMSNSENDLTANLKSKLTESRPTIVSTDSDSTHSNQNHPVAHTTYQRHRRCASDSLAKISISSNINNFDEGIPRLKYSAQVIQKRVPIFHSDENVLESSSLTPIPPTESWTAPKPTSKDQSLQNYLQSGCFSQYQAELDKELAHIILAEAIIQGINIAQYESATQTRQGEEGETMSAPVDLDHVQNMLRNQRFRRHRSNVGAPIRGQIMDHVTNSLESSVMSSSFSSGLSSPIFSDDESNEDEETPLRSPSQPSDIDTTTSQENGNSGRSRGHRRESSAESLALALLHLKKPEIQPKVCDLKWLVGDEDTPQKPLPLPQDFQALSDSTESPANAPVLRGTNTWAPPRPQLILKTHVKKKVFPSMQEQNFQCAGCSMTVQMRYIKTFRYCSYFGKYFCTSCHLGQTSVLPAKIIHNWNFKEEPVSTFARSVIKSLFHERLFFMEIISPELVKRAKRLRRALKWRRLAHIVFPYVMTCNRRHDSGDSEIMSLLKTIGKFDIEEPAVLTLNEICSIKLGSYLHELPTAVEAAKLHILQCKYCHMRGHLCEGCRSEDVLFSFQTTDVAQCETCKACYHKTCLEKVLANDGECTKCWRIKQRKMAKLNATTTDVSS
ncbi:hypothetical protein TCAL_14677 [Tigriopus californicus]|uniref:RUN domain-containing protein n=1 Tax=Tigriopus californicus TaxID=6832 RepID=A0A553NPK1_TIGCA|nr:run domain Beclin-1-interacting and cysteine-rich domain-containing protein-like isoform X2 [Tigriopus californicus]TRY67330.1 hypothetical protein TCAL_14677 [Tigriopus californicus]